MKMTITEALFVKKQDNCLESWVKYLAQVTGQPALPEPPCPHRYCTGSTHTLSPYRDFLKQNVLKDSPAVFFFGWSRSHPWRVPESTPATRSRGSCGCQVTAGEQALLPRLFTQLGHSLFSNILSPTVLYVSTSQRSWLSRGKTHFRVAPKSTEASGVELAPHECSTSVNIPCWLTDYRRLCLSGVIMGEACFFRGSGPAEKDTINLSKRLSVQSLPKQRLGKLNMSSPDRRSHCPTHEGKQILPTVIIHQNASIIKTVC